MQAPRVTIQDMLLLRKEAPSGQETEERSTQSASDERGATFSDDFQLFAMHMDLSTGDTFMRGKTKTGETIGIKVTDYRHRFYLERQTPFKDATDAATVLCCLVNGLKSVMTTRDYKTKNKFKTPNPEYRSKTCVPSVVYVSPESYPLEDEVITSWTLLENQKKTMYGWRPKNYRTQVIEVRVQRPKYSSLLHKYIESDHFKGYYCGELRLSDKDFYKNRMLRTYEAEVCPPLIAFRSEHDLGMMGICRVKTSSPTCLCVPPGSDFANGIRKEVSCDTFFSCAGKDVVCTDKTEDFGLVVAGMDIEAPGRIMGGVSRFPVAKWSTEKYIAYAKEVLGLPPPVKQHKYVCEFELKKQAEAARRGTFGNRGRRGNFLDNDDDRITDEDGDMLFMLEEMQHPGISSVTDDGESVEEVDEFESLYTDGEKKAQLRNLWTGTTKRWVHKDWSLWIKKTLVTVYDAKRLREMMDMVGVSSVEELVPHYMDTDKARCICVALRNPFEDGFEEALENNSLYFSERVAFVYVGDGLKKPIDPRTGDQLGADIWGTSGMEIREFHSEAEMITSYLRYIKEKRVDCEEGWNTIGFDKPFLLERLEWLSEYGSEEEKRHCVRPFNFGLLLGEDRCSVVSQRYTYTKAAGDRLVRSVNCPLLLDNDGNKIYENSTVGDKLGSYKLDSVAMEYLRYSLPNVKRVVKKLMESKDFDCGLFLKTAFGHDTRLDDPEYENSGSDEEREKITISHMEKACAALAPSFKMKKMQYDIQEGVEACEEGGRKLYDFLVYCFMDAALPVFLNVSKRKLVNNMARFSNVMPSNICGNGVQLKVFSLIFRTCKKDFKGLYIIPDKGCFWIHWPGVFDHPVLGFVEAMMSLPEVKGHSLEEKRKENAKNAWVEEARSVSKAPNKRGSVDKTSQSTLATNASVSSNSSRGATTKNNFIAAGNPGGFSKRPFPPPSQKDSQVKKKAGTRKSKAKKTSNYNGALVLHPKLRGIAGTSIGTLDFESLYPSLCRMAALCFTTALTTTTIEMYGLLPWQYTRYPVGPVSETMCGEYARDVQAAKQWGYDTCELKFSHFYGEDPDNTIYGKMIERLKTKRSSVKKLMTEAEEVVERVKMQMKGEETAKKGSEEYEYLEKGVPLAIVKRIFSELAANYHCGQISLKLLNNSGYGFTSVHPLTAMISMMVIGATITALGRFHLRKARANAERVCALACRDYVNEKNELVERESVVDPESKFGRVSRKNGADYNPEWVNPKDVTERYDPKKGRKPLVDFSFLSVVKGDWVESKKDMRLLAEHLLDVIYGDTDSIMISASEKLFPRYKLEYVHDFFNAYRHLVYLANKDLYGGNRLAWEKAAMEAVFGGKKCYYMLLPNGKGGQHVLSKGMTEKRDLIPFVKRLLKSHRVLIFKELEKGTPVESINKMMIEEVKEAMMKLAKGEIPVTQMLVQKNIAKFNYDKPTEHAVAASIDRRSGKQVPPGSSIRFAQVFRPVSEVDAEKFKGHLIARRKYERKLEGDNLENAARGSLQTWVSNKRSLEPDTHGNSAGGGNPNGKVEEGPQQKKRRKVGYFTRDGPAYTRVESEDSILKNGYPLDYTKMLTKVSGAMMSLYSHVMAPKPDMPYADDSRMDKAKIEEIEKIQDRFAKVQKMEVEELLFGEFNRYVGKNNEGVFHNASRDYDDPRSPFGIAKKIREEREERISKEERERKTPVRLQAATSNAKANAPRTQQNLTTFFKPHPSASPATSNAQGANRRSVDEFEKLMRYCRCVICDKTKEVPFTKEIAAMNNVDGARVTLEYEDVDAPPKKPDLSKVRRPDFTKMTRLPRYVCDGCRPRMEDSKVLSKEKLKKIVEDKKGLDQSCYFCASLSDYPDLDTSKCKSAQCEVYQAKRENEAAGCAARGEIELLSLAQAILL